MSEMSLFAYNAIFKSSCGLVHFIFYFLRNCKQIFAKIQENKNHVIFKLGYKIFLCCPRILLHVGLWALGLAFNMRQKFKVYHAIDMA